MKQFFILVNGKSQGPFSLEDLRQKNIAHNTLVWHEGMETWQKAGMLPELSAILPPPVLFPGGTGWFTRISFLIMALIIAALVIGMLVTRINKDASGNEDEAKAQSLLEQREYEKSYTRDHIQELVYVTNSTYSVRLIGGISGLKVTLVNGSEFLVDLASVEVKYIKENGGIYKTEMLNFTNIKAHTSQTQHAPESKRGSNVESAISFLKSADIGL